MCNPVITETICGVPKSSFARAATPAEIAGLFCDLSDDEQAEFFVAVHQISQTWIGSPGIQFWNAGKHLGECEGARACGASIVVEELYKGMQRGQQV